VIFKISKTSIELSFCKRISTGKSTGISKTLPILHFLAMGAERINVSDFEGTDLSKTISSCRLEVSAKGL